MTLSSAPDNRQRIVEMEQRLRAALAPIALSLHDDSHKHIGHEGAQGGKGHFRVEIVSAQFAGLAPLARHRLVYAALGDLMDTAIHALSIDARAP